MESQHYFNPYSGQTFFGFFVQLALRLWGWVSGKLTAADIVSDEVQMLVLIGVAASSALVGTFLILRKMTMLANSLSHTILIGIVLAFLWTYGVSETAEHIGAIDLPVLLFAAWIMGIVTTFLTELLTKSVRLQEDASTGIVFTSLFAVGVIAVTVLTRSIHIGIEAVMGNVDALQLNDCKLVYFILGINLVLFVLFFKEFKITTFDPGLSRALGVNPEFFNYLLMTQVSLTAIGAFRAVGVLMLLAFITGPALTARLLTHSLGKMLALAVLIGALASLFGVAWSRHMLSVYGVALSTSGVVVCMIVIFYLATAAYANKHILLRKIR